MVFGPNDTKKSMGENSAPAYRFACRFATMSDNEALNESDAQQRPAAPAPVPAAAVVSREESPVRFGVVMAIGVTLLFQFGAQAVLMRFPDESMLPYITSLSQLLLMLAPAVYAARAQELPIRELFRLRKVSLGMHVATILGIVLLWPIVQSYLVVQELYLIPDGLFDSYRQMQNRLEGLYDRLLPPGAFLAPLLALAAAALVPAVCEEAVFRGATQRSFERRMRPWVSIVVSGLLFAGLHLQPHNLVPLAILGSFLGLAAWASRSIYPAIVGHFLFNATMVGILYTMRARGERPSASTEDDLVTLLPGVLVCIVGLVFVVRWLAQRGPRSDDAPMPIVSTTPETPESSTTTDEH